MSFLHGRNPAAPAVKESRTNPCTLMAIPFEQSGAPTRIVLQPEEQQPDCGEPHFQRFAEIITDLESASIDNDWR